MALTKKTKIAIVVIAVIAIAIVIVANMFSGQNLSPFINKPVNMTQISDLESIAANSTLAAAVGPGIATFPKNISGAAPLKLGGKPEVLYMGAEYCPFCAAGRWGLIIALMRFGTFSNLHYMISSTDPSEPYRGTATFTFVNSTYTSPSVAFVSVETEDQQYNPLQTPNSSQINIFNQYNYAQGGIPFIDFGNMSVLAGADYSPGLINGNNWGQIIANLYNPSSPMSQGVIGSANIFTAEICKETNMSPSSVCGQPYIKKLLSSQ
jgi:hypothetical protein